MRRRPDRGPAGTQALARILRCDRSRMAILRAVSVLRLPDAAVGAGFVRSAIWDAAHGFLRATPLSDVDVLFFDAANRSRSHEVQIELALRRRLPGVPFSVRNQARMHRRNGDHPYRDTADAMRYWLETATCVAVRLRRDGGLEVLAPYGLGDLLSLRSRPTPSGQRKIGQYQVRMTAKDWPAVWPKVTVDGCE